MPRWRCWPCFRSGSPIREFCRCTSPRVSRRQQTLIPSTRYRRRPGQPQQAEALEYMLRAGLHPQRLCLDQFVIHFLASMVAAGTPGPAPSPASSAQAAEQALGRLEEHQQRQQGLIFFQRVDIGSCRVRIDYRPHRADLRKFLGDRGRGLTEALNLVPLKASAAAAAALMCASLMAASSRGSTQVGRAWQWVPRRP